MSTNYGKVEAQLEALNIRLDSPNIPAGNYVSYSMAPPFLYLSGVTPKVNGKLMYKGKVGLDLTKEEGYQAARQCIINQLSTIQSALGQLDRVVGIVKMNGFIHAAPEFYELPFVLNGASNLLVDVFGDLGVHARSAIGVATLPGGAAVEVELIVRYE
ncbi:MAG: RidA family protein [Paenibacillaceae bacterium]